VLKTGSLGISPFGDFWDFALYTLYENTAMLIKKPQNNAVIFDAYLYKTIQSKAD